MNPRRLAQGICSERGDEWSVLNEIPDPEREELPIHRESGVSQHHRGGDAVIDGIAPRSALWADHHRLISLINDGGPKFLQSLHQRPIRNDLAYGKAVAIRRVPPRISDGDRKRINRADVHGVSLVSGRTTPASQRTGSDPSTAVWSKWTQSLLGSDRSPQSARTSGKSKTRGSQFADSDRQQARHSAEPPGSKRSRTLKSRLTAGYLDWEARDPRQRASASADKWSTDIEIVGHHRKKLRCLSIYMSGRCRRCGRCPSPLSSPSHSSGCVTGSVDGCRLCLYGGRVRVILEGPSSPDISKNCGSLPPDKGAREVHTE